MKAMIFAAGLGTRLRPITDNCPKALVVVGGEPMLGRVLKRAIASGVSEAVVNVHHFPQMIIDYLAANNNFGINIHVSREDDMLLDTGGGLLAAWQWLDGDEDILVHNADIFTDADYNAMLRLHKASGAMASLLAWQRNSSRALLVDNEGMMRGWVNRSTGQVLPPDVASQEPTYDKMAFGGIHMVSPSIFPALERYGREHGPVFSIMPFYIDSCSTLPISVIVPERPIEWADIGKPAALESLRKLHPSHL